MTPTLIGGYSKHDIPVALKWATGDIQAGDFPAALGRYRKVVSSLNGLPAEEIDDADAHQAMLQEAEYGVAVTLLRKGDDWVWDARDEAVKALEGSFKNVPHGSDPRRYVLVQLSEANTPGAFGAVWTHLISVRSVTPNLV